MTVTVDRDRLRRTTAPHLLCERARTMPDSVAFRSKHFGIYRERRWRDYAALVAHAARALAGPRHRARRARRHHGRCLRRVDDLRSRRAIARRHHLRHLSDRGAGRGRVPDARRRRLRLHRRRPGICRQDPADRRPAAGSARDRRARRFRDVRLRAREAAPLRRSAGRGGEARPGLARKETGGTFTGRSRLHRLYVRHDRPSEGRAGQPRQASCRHRHRRSRIIRRCARSRIAPSSICRCAMCSAATSPSRCR